MGLVLVRAALDRVEPRDESDRSAEIVAGGRELAVVEVGQRHDEPDAVRGDELAQRVDVAGIVDARHGRPNVGVVQSRRERIEIGRDRRRAGLAERRDNVDALPGAGEENGRHSRGA